MTDDEVVVAGALLQHLVAPPGLVIRVDGNPDLCRGLYSANGSAHFEEVVDVNLRIREYLAFTLPVRLARDLPNTESHSPC